MKITGKIEKIMDAVTVGNNGFTKRDFVIEYVEDNPDYPQKVLMQTVQDKVSMLDAYQPGQNVEVDFNLRGREWIAPDGVSKFFNTLQAWRMTLIVSEGAQNTPQYTNSPEGVQTHTTTTNANTAQATADDGDLPFQLTKPPTSFKEIEEGDKPKWRAALEELYKPPSK